MRKQFTLALLLAVLFVPVLSGCGPVDEKTRIKNAMVEAACTLMKPLSEQMKNIDPNDTEAQTKALAEIGNMETKLNDIIKKHGFKDQAEIEAATKKYDDDKGTFKAEVSKTVKDSCGFDMESEGFN